MKENLKPCAYDRREHDACNKTVVFFHLYTETKNQENQLMNGGCMEDLAALAEKAKAGDADAYARLYAETYRDMIWSILIEIH